MMRWGGQSQAHRRTDDRDFIRDAACFVWIIVLVFAAAAVQ